MTKTTAKTEPNAPPAAPEKYPVSELVASSKALFGVMPEVVVGALHGNKADELTKNDVSAAIEQFKKRKVKEYGKRNLAAQR